MSGVPRLLCLLLVTAACVPSRAAMYGPVDRDLERRLGIDVAWHDGVDARVPDAVATLLAQPLDLDAALRIAMAQNQRLQAAFDELGVAAGAIAEATVLPPTEVDLAYKRGDGHDELEIEVVQDLLDLLTIGKRRGIAGAERAAAQARATAAAVELAMQVEMAFYDAVAAQQELELRTTAFEAADAALELSQRMHDAGNTTDLALARDREAREQASVDVAHAEVALAEAREALNAQLGLSGEPAWTTVEQLPEIPDTAPALDGLEDDAVSESLELAALRAEADAAGGRAGQARLRTVLPTFGAGVAVSRRAHEGWEAGPAVRLGLPIFDQQQGPRARAKAEQRRARHLAAATEVDLRAQARAARKTALAAHGEALKLRDTILPLRHEILDELVRHYNAMNASTFELLEAKHDLVDAGSQYIEALRRYWTAIARTEALRRGAGGEP